MQFFAGAARNSQRLASLFITYQLPTTQRG
jgi:hypothetical protein